MKQAYQATAAVSIWELMMLIEAPKLDRGSKKHTAGKKTNIDKPPW